MVQARRGVYSRTAGRSGSGSSTRSSSLPVVLTLLSLLIFIGIIFSVTMAPHSEDLGGGPGTNSMLLTPQQQQQLQRLQNVHSQQQQQQQSGTYLSQKILEWSSSSASSSSSLLSSSSLSLLNGHHAQTDAVAPDWRQEFWSPIDLDLSYVADPEVTLCRLNFKTYTQSPHLYPMFRDLETLSNCRGSNRRKEKMASVLREVASQAGAPGGRYIAPTAFVFHESRVGSTLVANTLASDPFSMVFSESAPAANALLHCSTCSLEKNIEVFRQIVTLMGRSPIHRRLFFKFQSITCTKIHIALQAFPDTPWVFVYRTPVQTMMSHLDPRKGSGTGAPCLRSMREPPEEVRQSIADAGITGTAPRDAWCAAHLNMLCNNAVRAYRAHGRYTNGTAAGRQRGFLVNYESLPGAVPRLLLPSFGIEPSEHWLTRMAAESKQYSKSRGSGSKPFLGDSEDKEERATQGIQKFAKAILEPTFAEMETISSNGLREVAPALFAKLSSGAEGGGLFNWQMLKDVPVTPSRDVPLASPAVETAAVANGGVLPAGNAAPSAAQVSGGFPRGQHSSFSERAFEPWAPFSNTHSSRPYEAVNCPPTPTPDYPVTYNMHSEILANWNTDNTEIPPFHYDSLCHFDFQNKSDQDKALAYRKAERPFVVYNIPEVDEVVRKWNNIDYLHRKLGKRRYRTETSKSNHFMYWHGGGNNFRMPNGQRWEPPTGIEQETFETWLELAVKGQNKTMEARTHEYFRVSSDLHNEWLFEELPFFKPRPSLMIVDPREQRGIHCRFGMRNIIAEAHFDGSRNAVVMLGGLRRWVLTHPDQCVSMHMLPKEHPSGRHSDVDWSQPDVEKYPNFVKVRGNEVILQPGDFLYVPTYWIHYIVSLNVNFQCNTRSGRTAHFDEDIRSCGF